MNRTFKRVISSVLAFVMVMSCMIVINVSSVLAADRETVSWTLTDYTKWYKSSDNSPLTENGLGNFAVYQTAEDTAQNEYKLTFHANNSSDKIDSNGITMSGDSSNGKRRYFEIDNVPANCAISVEAKANGKGQESAFYYVFGDGDVTSDPTLTDTSNKTWKFANSTEADSSVKFYFGSKSIISKIELILPGANTKTYKITGSSNGLTKGDKFKVGDFTATVVGEDNSTWKYAESGDTSPFKTDQAYSITAPKGFSANPESVTFTTDGDGVIYSASSEITFKDEKVSVSGTVSDELVDGKNTDKIIFTDSDGDSVEADISSDEKTFSVKLPKGEYSVFINSEKYKALQKYLAEDCRNITVNADISDLNVVAGDTISEWNFDTDKDQYRSSYSYQSNAKGTIKGIYIDSGSGKFAFSDDRVQVNKNTNFYVPVYTAEDKVNISIYGTNNTDLEEGEIATVGAIGDDKLYKHYTVSSSSSGVYLKSITVTTKPVYAENVITYKDKTYFIGTVAEGDVGTRAQYKLQKKSTSETVKYDDESDATGNIVYNGVNIGGTEFKVGETEGFVTNGYVVAFLIDAADAAKAAADLKLITE